LRLFRLPPRDAVLAYLAGHSGEQGPPPDLYWTETRRAAVVGKATVEYATAPLPNERQLVLRRKWRYNGDPGRASEHLVVSRR
jgi:hypothetical protein